MTPSPPETAHLRHFGIVAGLTVLSIALSVAAITPRVFFWRDYPLPDIAFETARIPTLLAQLQNPSGWDLPYVANPLFGDNALRWRLLPPLIGHALHLPPKIYLGLPWLGLIFLVGTSLHYLRRRGVPGLGLLAAGVLAGTSAAFFGSSTSIGYFDCLYLLALVVFTFSPSWILATGACILGPWCDEKFLLMLPACACLRWAWQPSWRWVAGAAAGTAYYSVIRLLAHAGGDSSVVLQLDMQRKVFSHYVSSLPVSWWYAFRFGWVLLAVGVFVTWHKLPRRAGLLFVAATLAAVGSITFLAWDTTRSIAMLFPFLLAGATEPRLQRPMLALAAVQPFLPAAYLCCADPVTVPLTSFLR